jgi:hypothetical protein
MDMIMESKQFTKVKIRLNYCRLYLHAATVSDITEDANGKDLDLSKRQGEWLFQSSTTT